MKLRPELMPPKLDESLVVFLADLAGEIDCGQPDEHRASVVEFNQKAGTDFEFIDFQGVYGSQEHDTWVRKVLGEDHIQRVADVTRDELVELARRVCSHCGAEHEVYFWLRMLEINANPHISDMIYWPEEYFDDPDFNDELSPEQIIEIALRDAGSGSELVGAPNRREWARSGHKT